MMNRGRYADVVARSRSLIDIHPALASAWKYYGAALVLQGKDGLSALVKSRELEPTDCETLFYLGNAQYDREDFLGAIASHRRVLELKPRFAQSHDALGMALRCVGAHEEALASHRAALIIQPDYADAHGNMGNVLMDQGRCREAVDSYRRMCALEPESAEAHNSLGNALLACGKLDEAVASYQTVVGLRPTSAMAFVNLGNAQRGLGRAQQAAANCARAVELEPGLADAHRFLGDACFDLGRFDEAAASYQRAIAIDSTYVDAHAALGVVMRQVGRGDEAEACCQRALLLDPQSPETLALLGDLQAGRGDFAAAETSFKHALSIKPDLPEAFAGLARYRKMTQGDADWLAAVRKLLASPLSVQHSINLRYALGKYFDDVGEFDEAFANYRQANELTRHYGMSYDRAGHAHRVERVIETYDHNAIERLSGAGNQTDTPVFIVGMPRSGTTLAEQILASHPAVRGVGELRFWHAAAVQYEKARGEPGARALAAAFADRYLTMISELAGGAPKVIDKMPANFMNLGLMHASLPKARIIHLTRHPIDTCLSIYFQAFSNAHAYANQLQDLVHYYTQYSRLMAHWRATLPPAALLDVPYESLVEFPESWSRKMIEFLGLPWDPRCLDFHQTQRTVLTASSWQVRQKISTSSVGRFRCYEEFLGPLWQLLDDGAALNAAREIPHHG